MYSPTLHCYRFARIILMYKDPLFCSHSRPIYTVRCVLTGPGRFWSSACLSLSVQIAERKHFCISPAFRLFWCEAAAPGIWSLQTGRRSPPTPSIGRHFSLAQLPWLRLFSQAKLVNVIRRRRWFVVECVNIHVGKRSNLFSPTKPQTQLHVCSTVSTEGCAGGERSS